LFIFVENENLAVPVVIVGSKVKGAIWILFNLVALDAGSFDPKVLLLFIILHVIHLDLEVGFITVSANGNAPLWAGAV